MMSSNQYQVPQVMRGLHSQLIVMVAPQMKATFSSPRSSFSFFSIFLKPVFFGLFQRWLYPGFQRSQVCWWIKVKTKLIQSSSLILNGTDDPHWLYDKSMTICISKKTMSMIYRFFPSEKCVRVRSHHWKTSSYIEARMYIKLNTNFIISVIVQTELIESQLKLPKQSIKRPSIEL